MSRRLLVASVASDEILRYDGATGAAAGALVTAGSGGLDGPRGLAVGPDGRLYVSSQLTDSVLRYDLSTGAFIDAVVATGAGSLDYPGHQTFQPDRPSTV